MITSGRKSAGSGHSARIVGYYFLRFLTIKSDWRERSLDFQLKILAKTSYAFSASQDSMKLSHRRFKCLSR